MKKSRALVVIQRYFPNVTRLKDARRPIEIEVLPQDCEGANKKSMTTCALAKACTRSMQVEGAMVSPARVYLVNGRVAERFDVPVSLTSEIKIFDRAGGFQPGVYRLQAIPPYHRLGQRHGERAPGPGEDTGEVVKARRHYTSGIRKFA